jgi:hypothetical protein
VAPEPILQEISKYEIEDIDYCLELLISSEIFLPVIDHISIVQLDFNHGKSFYVSLLEA